MKKPEIEKSCDTDHLRCCCGLGLVVDCDSNKINGRILGQEPIRKICEKSKIQDLGAIYVHFKNCRLEIPYTENF
jgi:hypothetical protein